LFKRIVVGTDGSPTATEAVSQAIELARLSGARLDVVAAFEPVSSGRLREEGGEVPGDVQYAVGPREDVNVTLDGAVGKAKQEGVEAEAFPREGDPADAILDVAEETGAPAESRTRGTGALSGAVAAPRAFAIARGPPSRAGRRSPREGASRR